MSNEFSNKYIVRISDEILFEKCKYLVHDMNLILDSVVLIEGEEKGKIKLIMQCSHNISGYKKIFTSLISDKTNIENQRKKIEELVAENYRLRDLLHKRRGMRNLQSSHCGIIKVDCDTAGHKTLREVKLEEKLKIAEEALRYYAERFLLREINRRIFKINDCEVAKQALQKIKEVK